MAAMTLDNLLNPEVSRVTRSTDGLVIMIYGQGGLGKTPVATKMEKPFYLAFGKSGLSGINNVPFQPILDWAEFKQFNKLLCNRKNFDVLHEKYHTIILDEMEVLYKYCEEYVASTEGVRKIKEGNGGYGLWGDLKDEWEREMLRIIGSGYCVMFILHAQVDDTGKARPVGDAKRMLPILTNHSEIIGYVASNGADQETGRQIHSSLMLVDTPEWFARTRNEYFDPYIPDFTAENLVNAYYTALDRQEKTEGVTPMTKEEKDALFTKKDIPFEALMQQVSDAIEKLCELGRDAEAVDIIENTLGAGKKVSSCTEKQYQAVSIILSDLQEALSQE